MKSGMTSHDYQDDIPVAIATPEFVTNHQGSQSLLSKGRSSRVLMPESYNDSAHVLREHEVQALKAQGFTMGLIHAMGRNNQTFPMRIWVVDNSGM